MKMVEYYIHLLETGVCSFEQSVRTSPSKTCIYEGDVNRTEHSKVCHVHHQRPAYMKKMSIELNTQRFATSPSKTCIYEEDVNRTEHSKVCLRLKQLIHPEIKIVIIITISLSSVILSETVSV